MTSNLVASSPITHQPKNLCYDVFLSFRGDDTRDNFVSHLLKAFSDHQIKTFIDYNLTKGADIPPALLTAIEKSLISIIIFSENYANSTWCLKELAKIMECKNSNEQIVIPVFYRVDPSHVRNQTGNFGAAFDRLQKCSKGKMNFNEARSHLMKAANISGWDSHVTRPESQLIVGIVGDVLHKLNLVSFNYSTNLPASSRRPLVTTPSLGLPASSRRPPDTTPSITSRNRQVLKSVTDKIHTMETMNENDAMTLFSLNSFKQSHSKDPIRTNTTPSTGLPASSRRPPDTTTSLGLSASSRRPLDTSPSIGFPASSKRPSDTTPSLGLPASSRSLSLGLLASSKRSLDTTPSLGFPASSRSLSLGLPTSSKRSLDTTPSLGLPTSSRSLSLGLPTSSRRPPDTTPVGLLASSRRPLDTAPFVGLPASSRRPPDTTPSVGFLANLKKPPD